MTVRNIITSMRLISDVNWADLFEAVSLVEATRVQLIEHCVDSMAAKPS